MSTRVAWHCGKPPVQPSECWDCRHMPLCIVVAIYILWIPPLLIYFWIYIYTIINCCSYSCYNGRSWKIQSSIMTLFLRYSIIQVEYAHKVIFLPQLLSAGIITIYIVMHTSMISWYSGAKLEKLGKTVWSAMVICKNHSWVVIRPGSMSGLVDNNMELERFLRARSLGIRRSRNVLKGIIEWYVYLGRWHSPWEGRRSSKISIVWEFYKQKFPTNR